jgi:ribosomal protein S18 acetylase RimI-like enzyme
MRPNGAPFHHEYVQVRSAPYALPVRFADESLARRLEDVGSKFMLEWLAGTGAELERFGAAIAAVDPSRAELDFVNRVYGLWPEDAEHVSAIAGFYRERGVRAWLEVAPATGFGRLAKALTEAHASQIGFHSMLHGHATTNSVKEIEIERAVDPEVFADLLLRGHGVPEGARTRDRASVARWAEIDGWRLYIGRIDGEPAGAALLSIDDDLGYLANASTLPEYRRRGVQSALIAARVADARDAGCDAVSSQAEFGSPSQRNLERAGLQVAYTKAVWRLH